MFNVKWPKNYIRLLDTLNVFNIDVLELTGASCATKIDHSAKLTAMACFPLVLVFFACMKLLQGKLRSNSRIKNSNEEKHAALWKNAVEQAFDVVDHDGNEIADPDEMMELFQHMGVKLTEKETIARMKKWTNDAEAVSIGREEFIAVLAADANTNEFITRAQQDKAIAWTDAFVTVSQSLSGVGELMFAIHAPVSQAAFEWFWFVSLGDSLVLRVDPGILYGDAKWNQSLPVAIFVLVILTAGLPVFLAFYLIYHRNELDSVGVLSRFGWSYDRYRAGIEWWGIHEILRKAILTGMLIYIPSVSLRVSVALIVSIVAVMNLNLFEPFKNKIVFWVSEVAFVMTSIKYVTAMLRLSSPEENSDLEERSELVGTFLIAIDIVSYLMFALGSVLCVVWLARAVEDDVLHADEDDSVIAVAKRQSMARRGSKHARATQLNQGQGTSKTQVMPVKGIPELELRPSVKDKEQRTKEEDAKEESVGLQLTPAVSEKEKGEAMMEAPVEIEVPKGVRPGQQFSVSINGTTVHAKAPKHGRRVSIQLERHLTSHMDL